MNGTKGASTLVHAHAHAAGKQDPLRIDRERQYQAQGATSSQPVVSVRTGASILTCAAGTPLHRGGSVLGALAAPFRFLSMTCLPAAWPAPAPCTARAQGMVDHGMSSMDEDGTVDVRGMLCCLHPLQLLNAAYPRGCTPYTAAPPPYFTQVRAAGRGQHVTQTHFYQNQRYLLWRCHWYC